MDAYPVTIFTPGEQGAVQFSFTLRPDAPRFALQLYQYDCGGVRRIVRMERFIDNTDGTRVVSGSIYRDPYGQSDFLPVAPMFLQV